MSTRKLILIGAITVPAALALSHLTLVHFGWLGFLALLCTLLAIDFLMAARGGSNPGERLRTGALGETGKVVSGFDGVESGKVMVRGELWAARLVTPQSGHLEKGRRVRVVAREGMTLVVEADSESDETVAR
jgi:membrane protein implicated in regulation of membrane protease activity